MKNKGCINCDWYARSGSCGYINNLELEYDSTYGYRSRCIKGNTTYKQNRNGDCPFFIKDIRLFPKTIKYLIWKIKAIKEYEKENKENV